MKSRNQKLISTRPLIKLSAGDKSFGFLLVSGLKGSKISSACEVPLLLEKIGSITSISELIQKTEGALALAGVVLGFCWADEYDELESVQPTIFSKESLFAYGESVFEELHEAGWSTSDCVSAAMHLAREWWTTNGNLNEAVEKANFTQAPKAKRASSK